MVLWYIGVRLVCTSLVERQGEEDGLVKIGRGGWRHPSIRGWETWIPSLEQLVVGGKYSDRRRMRMLPVTLDGGP